MGMFDFINDLLDENSQNSVENRLLGGIDKLEQTLDQTLGNAEEGIQKASEAFEKLENRAQLAEEKVTALGENPDEFAKDNLKRL